MKRLILISVASMILCSVKAQQDEQFSQNMFNRLHPNPGVAGSNNAICATLLGRSQWVGFDGKPESYLLSVHAPVPMLLGGVGLTVRKDQLGQENTTGLKLAYAYRMVLGTGDLGIGVGLGMLSKQIGNNWRAIDDVSLDTSIPDNGAKKTTFDMDLGLYYKTDKLYVGISSLHLPSSTLKASDFKYKIARHYYIMAGYDYDITSLPLTLQPSVFVKTDGSSTIIDLNVNALYNNMVWAGVTFRANDAIVPMVGFMKEGIANGTVKIGYSYDVTTSLLKNHSKGTHEIMLGYCFNLPDKSKVQKHKTVRFL